jgi:hypothetical protein
MELIDENGPLPVSVVAQRLSVSDPTVYKYAWASGKFEIITELLHITKMP